ncbi:ROK family protein [Cellulomonas sp. KRMCY2]|uniref:ROK family protein n=1 Tax=Cellulomonas sp. KRMCY2 TaxID=1304865 RepID=UPI00045E67B0|nr:ROK family protein [Cellulomonas sp. KRMCY2]
MTGWTGTGTSGWSVGLDIGGTKVHGVLLDADDAVRGTARLPTQHGIDGVVGSAAEAVRQLCGAAGLAPGDLVGVGVGVPGVVDPLTGAVSHAVNLGVHARDVPLGALLSERLPERLSGRAGEHPAQHPAERAAVRVAVENDLNAAALGAASLLDRSDLAVLALGTGLAAGLVLDGRLRRGHLGGAGEIGHLTYVLDGPLCPCGQRGCLELYASGSAIDAVWPSRSGRPAPAEVFEAAAAGDPEALRVRDGFVDAVSAAVRLLVLTCDVERVLLAGGVAEIGAPLLEAVASTLRRQAQRSEFLKSMRIADRLGMIPTGALVAPIGAALAVRERPRASAMTEAVPWRS